MAGVMEYPHVSVTVGGAPVVIENVSIHNMFSQAAARGLEIDVWFVTPWETVVEGVESGDSPSPWVYRWQTIQPVIIAPGHHLDGSGGPIYMRLQNPSRDMTAMSPGLGEAFICLNADGSSYQVGGAESNGNFLRGFARGATIWAVVVAAVVVTAGAVSDYGVASSVAATPASASVTASATVVESAPAFVGPLETASSSWTLASVTAPAATVPVTVAETAASGWTLAEVTTAVKTTAGIAKTAAGVIGTVKAAVSAVTNPAPTTPPANVATPSAKPADNSALLLASAVSLLLFLG